MAYDGVRLCTEGCGRPTACAKGKCSTCQGCPCTPPYRKASASPRIGTVAQARTSDRAVKADMPLSFLIEREMRIRKLEEEVAKSKPR